MRRTKTVTVDWGTRDTNRDYGRQFLLTEMPAHEAEEIAVRVLGERFPDTILTYGFAGVAILNKRLCVPYSACSPPGPGVMPRVASHHCTPCSRVLATTTR